MGFLRSCSVTFNRLHLWHRRVRIGTESFRATSLDRLVYLWRQKLLSSRDPERQVLGQLIKPGMHVVDAGANLGVYAHLFARLVGPSGRVTAFEPDPVLYSALVENVRANGLAQIHPQQLALGADNTRARLQRGTLNSGDNRMMAVSAEQAATAETSVVTLDDFLHGAPVDFIKMDIQGWELQALRGMERTLAANPRIQLYIELWPYGLHLNGQTPADLFAILSAQGFQWDFYPARLRPAEFDYAALARQEYWYADLHAYRR